MTNDEWKTLSTLRVFRSGEITSARKSIDSILLGFEITAREWAREPIYKNKLESFARTSSTLSKKLAELKKMGIERKVPRPSNIHFIQHPHPALPTREEIRVLQQEVDRFHKRVVAGISEITNANKSRGPKTQAIHDLVKKLNRVVLEHSNGGSLTRSDNNTKGKGNDVEFVFQVLGMVWSGSGKRLRRNMAIQAIRNIRKPSIDLPHPIGKAEIDYQVPKSLLDQGNSE